MILKLKKTILRRHILPVTVICIYFAVGATGVITCPIRALLDIPCPTCGVTRAMLSLVTLDLEGYVHYNVMALPLIVAVLVAIHRRLFKHKAIADILLFTVLAVNTVYYAFRLWSILG